MSVDPNSKLSELDVARYRVLRLLMQSEDLAYLARLEEQLSNVLDPERLAKEKAGEVLPAAALVMPKPVHKMTSEERTAHREIENSNKQRLTRKDWAALVETDDELSEEEVEAMMNDK